MNLALALHKNIERNNITYQIIESVTRWKLFKCNFQPIFIEIALTVECMVRRALCAVWNVSGRFTNFHIAVILHVSFNFIIACCCSFVLLLRISYQVRQNNLVFAVFSYCCYILNEFASKFNYDVMPKLMKSNWIHLIAFSGFENFLIKRRKKLVFLIIFIFMHSMQNLT